jgi:prefoldin subunit 5
LVPLTNSLYVRGELSDPKRVIVDVGTGFYVEKVGLALVPSNDRSTHKVFQDNEQAEAFYDSKVKQIGDNIQDLELIVQRKTANVRSVEDGESRVQSAHRIGLTSNLVLRQKVLSSQEA